MSFRIEHVHVWAVVGDDDEEGIIGMNTVAGWMPFVAADQARLESLRPNAEEIARALGKKVRLLRFTVREELEVVG